jgi:hypothetical protein
MWPCPRSIRVTGWTRRVILSKSTLNKLIDACLVAHWQTPGMLMMPKGSAHESYPFLNTAAPLLCQCRCLCRVRGDSELIVPQNAEVVTQTRLCVTAATPAMCSEAPPTPFLAVLCCAVLCCAVLCCALLCLLLCCVVALYLQARRLARRLCRFGCQGRRPTPVCCQHRLYRLWCPSRVPAHGSHRQYNSRQQYHRSSTAVGRYSRRRQQQQQPGGWLWGRRIRRAGPGGRCARV